MIIITVTRPRSQVITVFLCGLDTKW